ncbi:MAG: UDP-N-acetylmuramoyl-tripeptide--D-alanyl-D-alanine ligase [Nitrospirae bacterium]|nr:UDP-N-acetylmuramoyl-tripeptide--D-alanyl-D-alanine ligase [Nitrospirota bacterium]
MMATLILKDILEATRGKRIYGEMEEFPAISIDSRTIKDGELFIALKGYNFDGHDFLHEALKKGDGALVSIPPSEPPNGFKRKKTLICVGNTLRALQDIAHFLRIKKDIPVIAITGTNGKTTTKELVAGILGSKFRVLKNSGNLNNQIGLPLSLSSIEPEHDAVVLEMGASAPGDIKELCAIASPGYGVVTNIGHAHLEGFGDIHTLRKTKCELLETVHTVSVNADDSFLLEGINGYKGRIIRYGIHGKELDVYADDIEVSDRGSKFLLHIGKDSVMVNLKVGGLFNIYNALAGSSIGYIFGIGTEDIKSGLQDFKGVPMRFEIKRMANVTLLSDVYNANPASMEEAIKEMIRLKEGRSGRAIAVLGDMLELGPYGETAHRKLGSWMSGLPVDLLIAVGPLMSLSADSFSGVSVKAEDSESAKSLLLNEMRDEDIVLVKGSRGMKMERVIEDAL